MAAYLAPTTEEITAWCGLDGRAIDQTAPVIADALTDLLPNAEALTSMRVGAGTFGGDITTQQAQGLKTAVAYRAGAAYLVNPGTRKATGTFEPLDQEESKEIRDQAADLRAQAKEIEDAVIASRQAADAAISQADQESRTGFSDTDRHAFTLDGLNW
jgi:hypothetical protein